MRVLVLTQYYPPENAFYAASVARNLASRGHEVRVLTGFPNYPVGQLLNGYQQHWRTREIDGDIQILRVPLYTDHSQTAARRLANYLSFGLSAATARSYSRGVDVIYVYAPQMTPAIGPWLWQLTGGAPYVLHVQDLWPDSITGSSLVKRGQGTKIVESLLTPWLTSVYRRAAAVIGIAPTMVKTLIERGVDEQKAHLIYNWALEDFLSGPDTLEDNPPSRPDATRVLYGGNIGDMQDLETAIRAAHQASDAGIHLTVVGGGVAFARVRALAEELGCTNVDFVGSVPRAQMAEFYEATDYALITLKDLPTFRGTIPSKFQAALSHGVPLITTVQGDLRALVENLGVGFTADVEDAESLASAFRAAATQSEQQRAQMSERARLSYANKFSQASGVEAIETILMQAAQEGGRAKERMHATA